MGVDVSDLAGLQPGIAQGRGHGAGRAVALRIGRGHVVGVAGHGVAADLRVDASAAAPRHARATRAGRGRRPRHTRSRRGRRRRAATPASARRCGWTSPSSGRTRRWSAGRCGLGPARDHHVGVAALDDLHGVADGVVAGGAGGDHREFGPLAPKRMEMSPDAMLTIIMGTKKGDTRSGPLAMRRRGCPAGVLMPPMPEPTRTPKRFASTRRRARRPPPPSGRRPARTSGRGRTCGRPSCRRTRGRRSPAPHRRCGSGTRRVEAGDGADAAPLDQPAQNSSAVLPRRHRPEAGDHHASPGQGPAHAFSLM